MQPSGESTLVSRIRRFMESPECDDFNALALGVFAHQYEHIEAVRRLADLTGRTPGTIEQWTDIPPVPARAFKRYRLFTAADIAHTFTSSGTSGAVRSEAHFSKAGLELMTASIIHNAQQFFLPDGRATVILVLAPSPELAPGMIMAWGMRRLIEHFGRSGSRFLVTPDGLDRKALMETLGTCTESQIPVTLIGASFGFVHLLDGLTANTTRFQLPGGSRLMDAGGFKGRSRVVERSELDAAIHDRLGIPPHRSVNLLGMTELASQFYDGVMVQGSARYRSKQNAPWTRTQVLDPRTMQPAKHGEPGLLCHWDLANVERPMVILTDDLGATEPTGWHVLGRARGAESKGCSLTIDDMLQGHAR